MRLLALTCVMVFIPFAVLALDISNVTERCLSVASEYGLTDTREPDRINASYCFSFSAVLCRFAPSSEQCLQEFEADIDDRAERIWPHIPKEVQGDGVDAAAMNRLLKHVWHLQNDPEASKSARAYFDQSVAWMPGAQRTRIAMKINVVSALVAAKARLARLKAK